MKGRSKTMKVGTLLNKPQTNPITRNGSIILRATSPAEMKALLIWSSTQNTPINFKLRDGSLITGVANNFDGTNTEIVNIKVYAKLENDEFSCSDISNIQTTGFTLNEIISAEPFCFINI